MHYPNYFCGEYMYDYSDVTYTVVKKRSDLPTYKVKRQ